MLKYIALIDYDHLDNPVFLKSLAQALKTQGARKGILVHGDSEYTNRLIQTGMMREDARKRAIMDLNHRLVALFADHGVSTIGLHGYQKELIKIINGKPQLNRKVFNALLASPMLLLSSLVDNAGKPEYVPPIALIEFLFTELKDHEIVIFSQDTSPELYVASDYPPDLEWKNLSDIFKGKHLSEEQLHLTKKVKLTTGLNFSEWPNLKNCSIIQ